MEFIIITPTYQKKVSILWLEINTPVGNFVIQPGHAPMILTLSPDKEIIFCLPNEKQESMLVKQGIIHITRTDATLLLNEHA